VDFGDSYDSNGFAVTASDQLNFISVIGALNERFDVVEFVDPKTAKLDISLEPIKLDRRDSIVHSAAMTVIIINAKATYFSSGRRE